MQAAYVQDQIVYYFRGDTRSAVEAQIIGIYTNEVKSGGVWVTTYTYDIVYYQDSGVEQEVPQIPEGILFVDTAAYDAYQSGIYNWDSTVINYP